MSTQSHDLHRSLLRPMLLHTLRAAGFHSTRPSVLDTLLNLAERHLLLLAHTTAKHAQNSHNDPIPTITDVRMALVECGVLQSHTGVAGAEQGWEEIMRRPIEAMAADADNEVQSRAAAAAATAVTAAPGRARARAEKRKREESDVEDVRRFVRWFDGKEYAEIKRVAGMTADGASGGGAVGVGGGKVHAEDFLTQIKKRQARGGDVEGEARLVGTVLGREKDTEEKGVIIEGGPVQRVEEWEERVKEMANTKAIDAQRAEGAMQTVDAAVG